MISLNGIALPAGLVWSDEFETARVAQSVRHTLDGSVVVFYGERRNGRPITLASEPDAGWLTRAQVEALAVLAESPGGIWPLDLRGRTWQVMFRHQDAPAFEAQPVVSIANPQPGDFYLATLKLMTV